MSELEKRVDSIEKRNKKVELDKKWETSWTRKNMYKDFNLYSSSIIFISN